MTIYSTVVSIYKLDGGEKMRKSFNVSVGQLIATKHVDYLSFENNHFHISLCTNVLVRLIWPRDTSEDDVI